MATLAVGDQAPTFILPDQDGHPVDLQSLRGKRILIYFYPKASTSGCTKQACSVRDNHQNWKEAGIDQVYGISPDPLPKLVTFAQNETLDFPLLSDEDHSVSEAYGVWGKKKLYGREYFGITRSSFLIEADGTLSGVWYKVKPEETVSKAIAAIH